MGWDADTQNQAALAGASVEMGTATLASNTIEVQTRMSKILSVILCYSADPSTSDSLWCDRAITAGKVTLQGDNNAEVQYIFIGLP